MYADDKAWEFYDKQGFVKDTSATRIEHCTAMVIIEGLLARVRALVRPTVRSTDLDCRQQNGHGVLPGPSGVHLSTTHPGVPPESEQRGLDRRVVHEEKLNLAY